MNKMTLGRSKLTRSWNQMGHSGFGLQWWC